MRKIRWNNKIFVFFQTINVCFSAPKFLSFVIGDHQQLTSIKLICLLQHNAKLESRLAESEEKLQEFQQREELRGQIASEQREPLVFCIMKYGCAC